MKVYLIAGAVAAAVALAGAGLWYTSDSHCFSQAVDATKACDYSKALELFSKINDSDSKYYQPALILGIEARSQVENPSAEVQRLGNELQQRLNDYVAETKFDEETFLAHTYYWQQIYQNWFYNQDSVQVDWAAMASAFENAEFRCDSLTDMSRLTAGYAYFLNSYYTAASEMFEKVFNSQYADIQSYAKGYVGVRNLYAEVRTYDRRQSYALLEQGPNKGLLALYKGDGTLLNNELSVHERIVRASDCYNKITFPHNLHTSTGFLVDMVNVRKNMTDSLIKKEVWRHPERTSVHGSSLIHFYGPTVSYQRHTNLAEGWGLFVGIEKNGGVEWSSIGNFDYGEGRFQTIEELTFNLKDSYYIAYYATAGHTRWGTTPGINNPAIYSCDITPLTMKFDLQQLYSNPYSPICRR